MKKEIKPEELTKNPFHMIGKEWMLVTAEKGWKSQYHDGFLGRCWHHVGKTGGLCVHQTAEIYNEFDGTDTFSCPFWVRSTERHCLIWEPYQAGMRIRSVNQDFM